MLQTNITRTIAGVDNIHKFPARAQDAHLLLQEVDTDHTALLDVFHDLSALLATQDTAHKLIETMRASVSAAQVCATGAVTNRFQYLLELLTFRRLEDSLAACSIKSCASSLCQASTHQSSFGLSRLQSEEMTKVEAYFGKVQRVNRTFTDKLLSYYDDVLKTARSSPKHLVTANRVIMSQEVRCGVSEQAKGILLNTNRRTSSDVYTLLSEILLRNRQPACRRPICLASGLL